MFPCFTGKRARRKQPENSPIAENRQSNERGDSLNTVKCTNVTSARTLVPMCDGQEEKAGHAAEAHEGGEEVLDLDRQQPQLSVSGIIFLCSRELTPAVTDVYV